MWKKLILAFVVGSVLVTTALAGFLYYLVVIEPGDEIQPDNIQRILARESEVYYHDGATKLGVFFDTAHRQYVSYQEIPEDFVMALVAAEDERFFRHFGFDPFGIARAILRNIEAGRVVEGGSTLTQQTAKNLFKRSARSFQEKLKELLYALRLEYHYSKEEIFEFYANQFYVSGTGHGLGVAARYYFDKSHRELTLLESAFIAGSVKRPNFYNPFIQKTEAAAENARNQGRIRLRYVLAKMRQLGMITDTVYQQSLDEELAFKQGRVGYTLDYVMEQVREAVSSNEVLAVLEEHGIDNIATSGVKIVTTVDKELQLQALAMLRSELSRLDVRLRGYNRDEVQGELASLDYPGDTSLQVGAFLFGTIDTVTGSGKDIRLTIDLGKNLGTGVIGSTGLAQLVEALVKYEKNLWAEVGRGDQEKLVALLPPGDRVWVRVVAAGPEVELELARYPLLQGAAIVVQEGAIRGMVGGSDNRFYNRAIQARRTMGSAFKTLVYAAALQLGWNSADLLQNLREVFFFHGKPYFPRPDHHSPFATVSMNWAGVLSENLASVWLLAHLCDHLSPTQFRDLAEHLDLAPKSIDGKEESYRGYQARIRDRHGVVVNRETLRAAAYRQAVTNLETDFIFAGEMGEYQILKKLPYGLNYDAAREELVAQLRQSGTGRGEAERQELELRLSLLGHHFLRLEQSRGEMARLRRTVELGENDPFSLPARGRLWRDEHSGVFSFLSHGEAPYPLRPVAVPELSRHLAALAGDDRSRFWQSIRLESLISVATFDRLVAQLKEEEARFADQLPYSFTVLSQVEDFRLTVSLRYLVHLGQALGIRSPLEPVLSFPLGSSVVTLLEGARMYEALVTGQLITFGSGGGDVGEDALAIIDRIESPDGRVLYRPTPVRTAVVDPKTSLAVAGILENVVKFGTGRGADRTVRLLPGEGDPEAEVASRDLTVPLLGKTGTANNYTNATFLGYVPGIAATGTALAIEGGYAVGVYVGFDDNRQMRRGSTRITGASGALPAWSGIATAILAEQRYLERLDPVDLSFYGLRMVWPELGQSLFQAEPEQGGRLVEPPVALSGSARYQPSILTFGRTTETGRFQPERNYTPFWSQFAGGER
jgi:penicillin-binding protein 1A